MLVERFEAVRTSVPLVHNITNYVTVNDCANIVLACGASPIMSDDQSEVEEITTICGGLNINIGTLNKRTIESMFLAGKRANALSHPVVQVKGSKLEHFLSARLHELPCFFLNDCIIRFFSASARGK